MQGQQLLDVTGVHSLVLKTNCLLVNSEEVRAVQDKIRLDMLGTQWFPLKQKGYENMPITSLLCTTFFILSELTSTDVDLCLLFNDLKAILFD